MGDDFAFGGVGGEAVGGKDGQGIVVVVERRVKTHHYNYDYKLKLKRVNCRTTEYTENTEFFDFAISVYSVYSVVDKPKKHWLTLLLPKCAGNGRCTA